MKHSLVLLYCSFFCKFAIAQEWKLQNTIYKDRISTTAIDTISYTGSKFEVEKFSDSLKNQFRSKGYLNLITQRDSTHLDFSISERIFLEASYKTIEIIIPSYSGANPFSKSSLSRKRKRFITPSALKLELSSLQNQLNNLGQPFAKINPIRWDFTAIDTAKLYIEISQQAYRKIDRVVVNGYPEYPKNVINNLLSGRSTYNSKNLELIQTQLSSLNYVEIIKEPEALFKNDSTLLYVYIKKKSANAADGLLGFNTNDNGDLELNGFLEASFINNFNYGEQIDLQYRNDSGDQSRLLINASFPGLIRKKIGLNAGLEIVRRDSIYQNTSLSVGLNYLLPKNAFLKISYENRSSTGTNNQQLDKNQDFQTQGILTSYSISQSRTDKLQPEDFNIYLEAGLHQRELENGKDFQYTLGVSAGKLWRLPYHLNLKTNINSYLLKTSNLQFNELKQVGGSNTIRGFSQNNIDTAAYTFLQTELRYVINSQIYVNILTDMGVIEAFTDRKAEYLYSFGGGLGILTRAGILRLQVAKGSYKNHSLLNSSYIGHIEFVIKF